MEHQIRINNHKKAIMKTIYQIFAFSLLGFVLACESLDTDFESFLKDGEIVYPGVVANAKYYAGNQRAALVWNPSPDPSITKYVIFWNNKRDSIVVEATTHNSSETMMAVIPNLDEYVYSFTVYSYDAKGNRSIPHDINNVKVYGPLYQGNLLNRPYNATSPFVFSCDGLVTLNFAEPDTINITTTIQYTNTSDVIVEKDLLQASTSVVLEDYKPETPVLYKSSYIPMQNAIDTFFVSAYDTFPAIYSNYGEPGMVNKSLINKYTLSFDATPYQGDTDLYRLWDGSSGPQGYPNIWHSDGNKSLPHTFTFDLGKTYCHLSDVEITGRNCCHNPVDMEIWGIEDITNANTTVAGNNSGWKDESIAKGWTLLKEVIRADDGQAALKVALDSNPPPVRYIRIRVKQVSSGDGSYSNLSEITFWND